MKHINLSAYCHSVPKTYRDLCRTFGYDFFYHFCGAICFNTPTLETSPDFPRKIPFFLFYPHDEQIIKSRDIFLIGVLGMSEELTFALVTEVFIIAIVPNILVGRKKAAHNLRRWYTKWDGQYTTWSFAFLVWCIWNSLYAFHPISLDFWDCSRFLYNYRHRECSNSVC
jgi:hypothetical protein